ncbi:MAG: 3-phosphoshikimate 1-carboxyvinyltransferase [Syntrophobacteraceae bacterium]|nr:3-phosphoshikimate 1-carboxyvinyltransferase [Syntrophobacteraceae bacterium]
MIPRIKTVQTISRMHSTVSIPGSKSISHRALIMAALANGESRVLNALASEDTLLTAQALRSLGVDIRWDGDAIRLVPPIRRWLSPTAPIMLGTSGTSMRLLPAVAALGSGRFVFDGEERLRERPVGPIVDVLGELGVACRYLMEEGFPPIEIVSEGLLGGEVRIDARQSSQFLSAMLLAAPQARGDLKVGWETPVASYPYVALTLHMMTQAGIRVERVDSNRVSIQAPQPYPALHYTVEGDCSSASYFWAAAAITGGDVLTVPISKASPQGDRGLVDVLETMGCQVEWTEEGVRVSGPASLKPVDIDMNEMPDMVPTLAGVAAFAEGETRIRNVAHLRVKESDRLHVVALELRKFQVPVEELEDGLVIRGGRVLSPGIPVQAHNDHRIAMTFAVMGLRAPGVIVEGAESVAKSFPNFWEVFDSLGKPNR